MVGVMPGMSSLAPVFLGGLSSILWYFSVVVFCSVWLVTMSLVVVVPGKSSWAVWVTLLDGKLASKLDIIFWNAW